MVQSRLRMVIGIRESISWVNFMERENIFGPITRVMMANSKVVWEMGKGYGDLVIVLVILMKDSTKMIWSMDLVFMCGPMVQVSRGHLKMIVNMGKVLLYIKMVRFLNYSGKMEM
jgi:hypothetical protein